MTNRFLKIEGMIVFSLFSLLSPVFSDGKPGEEPAYLPEKISSRISVVSHPPYSRSQGKKSIVIDGTLLGEDRATSLSQVRGSGVEHPWWLGFETALTNEEIGRVLFERVKGEVDSAHSLHLFRECRFDELDGLLRPSVYRVQFLPASKKNRTLLSNLYLLLGLIRLEVMNFTEAEDFFRRAYRIQGDNLISLVLLGDSYVKQGRFDRALGALQPLLSSSYYPVRLSALLSRIFQHENRIDRAIYHWKRVIDRISPTQSDLFRLRFLESEKYVQASFKTYSTAHYEVKYEPVFERQREGILNPVLSMVDEARWKLGRRFGVNPPDKTVVLVYSDAVFSDILGGRFQNLEAFFNLEDGKLRIAIKGGARNDIRLLRPVVFHEYVHRLVHYVTRGRLRKRWFHEGLATYYEREETGIDRFEGFSPDHDIKGFRLDRLLEEKVDAQGYYRARQVIEFMIKKYGEARLMAFLRKIGEGEDFFSAFESAFGISYSRFEELISREIR